MSTTLSDPDKIKALAKELERYGKNICSSYRAEIRNTERAINGASSKYYEYSSVTSKVREIQNLLRELERYSNEVEEKNYKLTKGLNDAANLYRDSEKTMKKETDLSRTALDVSSLNTKVKQNSTKLNEISERGKEAVLSYNAPEGIDPYQVNDCIRLGTSFINDRIDTVLNWAKELNNNLPLYAEEIKKKLDQFYEKLDDTAKKLVEDIKGLLDHIVTISSNYLEKLTSYAVSFKQKLEAGINGVKELIRQAGDKLGQEDLPDIINGIIDVRTGIFAKGIEEFSKIAAELRDTLSLKGEQLNTMISDFYEKLKNSAQNLVEDMRIAIDKMGTYISDKLVQLTDAILQAKLLAEQKLLEIEAEIKRSKENLEKDFKELEDSLGGDDKAKELVRELKKWLEQGGYIDENYSGSLQDVLKKVAVEVNGEIEIETAAGKITLSGKMVSADGTISQGNTEISGSIELLEGNIEGALSDDLSGINIGLEGKIRVEVTENLTGFGIDSDTKISVKVTEFQTDEISGQTKVFIDALGNSTGIEVTMDTKGKKYKEGPYAEVGLSWEIKQQEPLLQEQEVPIDIPIPVVIDKKWYEKAWDWITDTAIDAWEGVVDGATAAWEGMENVAETIGNFVEENKEVILTVTAVAAVVVVGVIVVATWPASMVTVGAICTTLTPVATNLAYR